MIHSQRVKYYAGIRKYNPNGARAAVTKRWTVKGRRFELNKDGTTKWYGVDEATARKVARYKNRFKQPIFTIKTIAEMEELVQQGEAKVFGDVVTSDLLRPDRGAVAESAKPQKQRRKPAKPQLAVGEKMHPASVDFEYEEDDADDEEYSNPFEGEADPEAEAEELLRRANSSAPVMVEVSEEEEPDAEPDAEPAPRKRATRKKASKKKTSSKKAAKKVATRRRRSSEV